MAKFTYTIEPLAAAIGHVTISWNHCRSVIFQMLRDALGIEIGEARAVFFALPSEQAQRDVTVAALEAAPGLQPALRHKAATAIRDFGKLSGERDDLVHAIWFFPEDDGRAHQDIRNNLVGKDPAQEAWRLSGELGAMSERLRLLGQEIANASKLGAVAARDA